MNAATVRALLRKRYQHPEWALCFEVSNTTGAQRARYADAVAMNLYPSRGLAIHGFEIKVSKSDFMNEINNPDKSVAVQKYCDHWWIVAPANAVDESLLPKTWGWLRVDGERLVTAKAAPELDPQGISREFMAAMVRRANEADAGEITKLVDDRVRLLRENDQKHIERQIAERTRKAEEALKVLQDLKEKVGTEDDWSWFNTDEVAAAVKLVRSAGIAKSYRGIRELQRELHHAQKRIARALEAIDGKQEEMSLEAAQ